jgi:hypothetical protein
VRNTSRESAAVCSRDLDPMRVLDRPQVRERPFSDVITLGCDHR